MNGRRPRTRYERTRAPTRRQLRADLSPGPVHPEDSALTEALAGPGKEPDDQASDGIRADGLPAEHPESMVLELAPADEGRLAAVSAELWPTDEYLRIVAEFGGAS